MYRFILVLLCGTVLSLGCEKPQVTTMGTPISVGGVTFTVSDYDVQVMEVNEGNQTFGYARPVLVIPVEIKNDGPKEFLYTPTHKIQQMGEATTPLLYADPGPEADLPPESKTPINGVYLEKGAPAAQLNEAQSIQAGGSITDLFLFEVPPEGSSKLIFSIPPAMHRGKLPVLIRFAYTPKEAKGPKIHEMGAPISFDKISLTVKSAKFEYVKTDDTAQGKGYSTEPLLKIEYMIENKSDEEVIYDPAHQDLSGKGAKLFGKSSTFKRVKFAASTNVEGQIKGQMKLEPNGSTTDFALFEAPLETTEATFEYPASLFGRQGNARVNIAIDPEKPEKPSASKSSPPKDETDG